MSQIEQPVEQSGIANLVQMTPSCSKLCVFGKSFFGKTCVKQRFSPKWLQFRKNCSRLSVLTEMAFFGENPIKTVFLRQNGFILGKAA